MILENIQLNVAADSGNVHRASVLLDGGEKMDILIETRSNIPSQDAVMKACVFKVEALLRDREILARAEHKERQETAVAAASDKLAAEKADQTPAETEQAFADAKEKAVDADFEDTPATEKVDDPHDSGERTAPELPTMKNTAVEIQNFCGEHGVFYKDSYSKAAMLKEISDHFMV